MKPFQRISTIGLVLFLSTATFGEAKANNLGNPQTPQDKEHCQEMYQSIEADLERANYCKEDHECDFIMLGGQYIKFGCFHYSNKAKDKEEIYKKMNEYNRSCFEMINMCAPAPDAICQNNKCVPKNDR